MLNINIIEDEELQDIVNMFISSLLPHSKFEAKYFSENLNAIFKYIHLEEFNLEYYVLLSILVNLNELRGSFDSYVPELTKESLESILETSLPDSILKPNLKIEELLAFEGLNNNLDIPSTKELACQKLFSRCVALYETCYSLEEPSSSVLNKLPTLKAAFLSHMASQSVITQSKILQGKVYLNRKEYAGSLDWLKYSTQINTELNNRINESTEENTLCVSSLEQAINLLDTIKARLVPIAYFGIPEIDEYTPMLQHRFIVIVGEENIGKSMMAKDLATNALLEGKRVLYMCGENVKSSMYCDILISYIYKKYNRFILPEHITHLEDTPENIQKIIKLAILEIVESGNLILRDSYSYDSMYDELVADYETYGASVYLIDHSYALTGGCDRDNGKTNVDNLSTAVREFRKKFPVCCVVLSHPSSTAKEAISRGNPITLSPTKGSQNLSVDADDVYVMRDDDILRKQGLVAIENTKRRNADRVQQNIILQKMYEVSHLEYDERNQATSTSLSVEADSALEELDRLYDNNYTL